MASILKVDTITGVATAGSIAVTGEGNSTTTNLQQGLGKSWWCLTGGNATISDSLNTSSATDHSTGNFSTTRTNNMSSTHYSASGACGRAGFSYNSGDLEMPIVFPTTSLIRFYTYNYDASVGDNQYISGQIDGDLA
tara:strand:+ start:324 stop:734 length:411 start_codon:yes stop_codon:yes gene_type:complete